MSHPTEISRSRSVAGSQPFPPGRIKICEALKQLLAEKEFGAITTAEIARTAGVTEGLIYKYFEDKRDLLHQVLAEYMAFFLTSAEQDLRGIKGALNKLRKLVWSHLNMYATDRVFARILVFEVRNFPDYFRSDAYQIVKHYGRVLEDILEEGVHAGEIRGDVSAAMMRQLILGGIEHACLPGLIFNLEIPVDTVAEDLCALIFEGIAQQD
jgi:TetR/AcrR family transcriptional regulator, fatty acid metabolism regulator protein